MLNTLVWDIKDCYRFGYVKTTTTQASIYTSFTHAWNSFCATYAFKYMSPNDIMDNKICNDNINKTA